MSTPPAGSLSRSASSLTLNGIIIVSGVVTLAAALLIAAAVGIIPNLAGAAAAAGVSAAVNTTLLVHLALAIHRGRGSFGPCRGAGFLGMGVLVGGITAVSGSIAPPYADRPGLAAHVVAGGLAVAVALLLTGLFLLPGAATTLGVRVRRFLDGLGVGICLLFAAWILVIAAHGGLRPLPFGVALVACTGVAVAVITGARAVRYRPAALACAGGAVFVTLGLAILAVALYAPDPTSHELNRAAGGWVLVAGLALVVGPVLAYLGAQSAGAGPREPDPAEAEGVYAPHPLLVLPVGIAVLAAVYHAVTDGGMDRTALILGLVAVITVAAREALSAWDVRRYSRWLAAQEAHFRSLVAGSTEVTVVVDADLVVRWQSPAAARHFGLSDQDVAGRPFTALVHPDDVGRVLHLLGRVLAGEDAEDAGSPALMAVRLRDGFGRWRDTESTVSDLRQAPAVGGLVMHVRDVGDYRELERSLRHLAVTDQLTGLANRRELLRAVDNGRQTPGARGAVLVIDLGGLSAVNDVRGHDIGDAVLVEVARRLRAGVGEHDLPVRLGGDEFAVYAQRGRVHAYVLATRLLTMLTEPYRPPGASVRLSASIGLAEASSADSVEEVLRRADLALRRAKHGGRGSVEWYDQSLEATLVRRMSLEQELPGILDRCELDLAYQLVMDLDHQRPVGAEALLRWRHPRLGTVLPDEFMPLAEQLELADQIGSWLLHKACRQLSAWLLDGWDLWLSVNVSRGQLSAPTFATAVHDALYTHQVTPERLVIELAEGSLATGQPVPGGSGAADCADLERIVAQLAALRAVGVRTALDHFGVGSTSLADLRRLPLDVLKIDQLIFTEPAGAAGTPAPILDVVVKLGTRLGLTIIAVGLDDQGHLQQVRAAGCSYGQGHLFDRPAPAERVEALMEQHHTRRL